MSLENSLYDIKNILCNRYKNNLAAILIFGSCNTLHFREGESDIDTMIFLKELNGLDLDDETDFLIDNLREYNFHTQYFHTLKSIRDEIYSKNAFSGYITITSDDGSRVLYSTPEFEKFKQHLLDNPLSKKGIKDYVKNKDEFELNGYFRDRDGFVLAKDLFSHIRRKLYILNYFETGELIFDYNRCVNNISLPNDQLDSIEKLYKVYVQTGDLSDSDIDKYYSLARKLTEKIVSF